MPNPGLIQIYTGDSKGKTTAALGLCMRAIGHGFRAAVVQFMKGSSYYGEISTITRLAPAIEFYQYGRVCDHNSMIRQGESDCLGCGNCFVSKGKATELDRLYSDKAMARSELLIVGGQHDLIVLDEVLNAIYFELISEQDLLGLIGLKPAHVEMVLTGRNAPASILDKADLVTEMKKVRHPYDSGIMARRGIEY